MPQSFWRKFRVSYREILIRLRAFRFFIFTFLLVTIIGAILLYRKFPLTPTEAYYQAVTLMFFASTLDYPSGNLFYEIMWIIYPIFGLILLADGLTGIGVSLKFGDATTPEWNQEVAKIMDDHVIVIGIGNLGIRVIDSLIETDWDVVIVDLFDESPNKDIIEEYQVNHRIPLIKGDATSDRVLQKAGILKAKAIMILIDEDFLNLKIAIQARKLNPEINIIMRMFDIEFGDEIAKKLNIKLLSTTQLAVNSFVGSLKTLPN